MFNIGPLELMVILLVALLVVGPKRLPEMSKTIGKSLRELRRTTDDMRRSIEFDLEDEDETPAHRAAPRSLPAETTEAAETTETAETAEPPPDAPPTGSAAE